MMTDALFDKYSIPEACSPICLDEQREIFDTLTRVFDAYGMTGIDREMPYFAVRQMILIGVVRLTEVRHIVAKVPMAEIAMAMVIGVSVDLLSVTLENEVVSSRRVLLSFVRELEDTTRGTMPRSELEIAAMNAQEAIKDLIEMTWLWRFYRWAFRELNRLIYKNRK